jgi:hypothetical protein
MQAATRALNIDSGATSTRLGATEWPTSNYVFPNNWRGGRVGAVAHPAAQPWHQQALRHYAWPAVVVTCVCVAVSIARAVL